MNLCAVKWVQCDKTQSTTVRTAHLSVLMTVHSTTQNTIQHRTVLITPPLPLDNLHSSNRNRTHNIVQNEQYVQTAISAPTPTPSLHGHYTYAHSESKLTSDN